MAREAAAKALAADDTLAEAHASMGLVRMWFDWDWKEAEREYLRAIELKPARRFLTCTTTAAGADRQIRRGGGADSRRAGVDPLSVPNNMYLAGVFHYRRDYDRSLEHCRRRSTWTLTTSRRMWCGAKLRTEAHVPRGHCRDGKSARAVGK